MAIDSGGSRNTTSLTDSDKEAMKSIYDNHAKH